MSSLRSSGVAWVIGSSGGIGRQVALGLHATSSDLHLCDRQPLPWPLADNRGVFEHVFDLAIRENAQLFARRAVEASGPPRTMVIAAGHVSNALVESVGEDDLASIVQDNFSLVVYCVQAFLESIEPPPARSSIVVIGSNAAQEPRPGQPIYAAMKAAVRSLIGSIAVGWGHRGVSIVGIEPGTVIVPRNRSRIEEKYPHAPLATDRPGGRLSTVEDVAASVQFAITMSDQLTGHTIIADGGSTLGRS